MNFLSYIGPFFQNIFGYIKPFILSLAFWVVIIMDRAHPCWWDTWWDEWTLGETAWLLVRCLECWWNLLSSRLWHSTDSSYDTIIKEHIDDLTPMGKPSFHRTVWFWMQNWAQHNLWNDLKLSLLSKSNLLKTMVTSNYDDKCVISVKSVKNRTVFVLTVIIEDDCIKATFCMKCILMDVIELILVI